MNTTGQTNQTSTTGVVSLLFGISAFTILPLLGAIAAILIGKMSLQEAPGNGFARAGIFLGWLNLGLFAAGGVLVLLGLLFFMPV
jgi:hypothetical protein